MTADQTSAANAAQNEMLASEWTNIHHANMGYNYDPSQENIDEEDPFGHIPSHINDKEIYGAVDMDNNNELPEGP